MKNKSLVTKLTGIALVSAFTFSGVSSIVPSNASAATLAPKEQKAINVAGTKSGYGMVGSVQTKESTLKIIRYKSELIVSTDSAVLVDDPSRKVVHATEVSKKISKVRKGTVLQAFEKAVNEKGQVVSYHVNFNNQSGWISPESVSFVGKPVTSKPVSPYLR